jgi:hypothetical protein
MARLSSPEAAKFDFYNSVEAMEWVVRGEDVVLYGVAELR